MKKMHAFAAVFGPLLVLTALLVAVLASHRGITPQARPAQLEQLTADASLEKGEAVLPEEALMLTGETGTVEQTVRDTLEALQIGYRAVSTRGFALPMLEEKTLVLVCTPDLSAVDGETLVELIGWVEEGGRLALMTTPDANGALGMISRKLGIRDMDGTYRRYTSLRYAAGALPFFGEEIFDQELEDYALPVRLEEDCTVYMQTADAAGFPLLWARDLGDGRIAVLNTGLAQGKDGRGFVMDALSALCDTLCYPVINAGMVFVDDFPAPQPEGFDERLKAEFGYDVQGFFRNHWWPDMKELTWKYGLRYTGVLVETYNQTVTPPFAPDGEDHALIRYYTSELLQSGGEIGLHGYNHQPLCPQGFAYAGEDYRPWPSMQNMGLAIRELVRYGQSFLPDAEFTTYVPPSNYLSAEGQAALLDAVPGLTTISGLYLPEEGVNALVQEFGEEADGSISVPRITSGFSMDGYNRLTAAHELMLRGVFSHFIHPDDVLDVERGAQLGWTRMYADFDAALEDLMQAYPALRWCTASEGAAAVQRYSRVHVLREWEGETLSLELTPFYDEVWLALRCKRPPDSVENAQIYALADGLYWLRATDAQVRVTWEARK